VVNHQLQPIIGPDGYDQFEIGPLLRAAQIRWGTYPDPPRHRPWHPAPLRLYAPSPDRDRDPIVVHVKLDQYATRAELAQLNREVDALVDAVVRLEDRR
jgi:hypothetical protein